MYNKRNNLGAGDAFQPEDISNPTSQQLMQFPGCTDLHDEVEKEEQERPFGTHVREAVEIVKDWASEKNRS
jgi:hypothetical protein